MAEVHVIGRILAGTHFEKGTGYFCKWTIDIGIGWKKVSGCNEGQTQVDTPSGDDPLQVSTVQWSHPIDIHLATTGIQGWPKITLQVCRQDEYGRSDLSGYGVCYLPVSPGTHIVKVPTWRPTGTGLDELERYFVGGSNELRDDEIISNSSERYRLHTIPSGTVVLELGIILKNFTNFGIET